MKNHTEININIEDDVEIEGDPTKLGQVLTNLIVNASQAYGEKEGKIDMSSGRGSVWLERCVRDAEAGGSNPLTPTIYNSNGFRDESKYLS